MREMKDSGVKWIGEIPQEWKMCRLKNYAYIMNGADYKDIQDDNGNYPVIGSGGEFDRATKYLYDGESVLLGRKGTIDKPRYINGTFWTVDTMYYTKIKDIGIAKYLYYLCTQIQFDYYQYGSAVPSMTQRDLNSVCFPLPKIVEQENIVHYLDSKCSKIDEIIGKQQAIIEKLKEYKLSIITEAVTSGINPDVEMKDSGSVWFGSIPINWQMKRLKYVFHIQKDIAGEEGHTVLSITQRGIIPKDFSNNEGQFANSYANYQLVHKGDFAMNHMDLLTGWVDISKYEGVTSPDYRVFVLNDKNGMCPEYYLYMMQMCYSARIFYGLGQGVSGMGRWRLQADKFLNFYIPIPPYDEQKKIADYITDKVNHIEVEIDKRNKLIKKYQEYKKSLIYEVVTGKKEV